jgi:sulfotransferase
MAAWDEEDTSLDCLVIYMAMNRQLHFIAGLPRSGSTLLSAILRQNPSFRASISSPLADMFASLLNVMSSDSAFASRISDDQRTRVLRALCDAYYAHESPEAVVFDTNRRWNSFLPVLAQLFPTVKLIVCVRSPAWILDSLEQQVQRNAIRPAKFFKEEQGGTVYSRVSALMSGGMVSSAIHGLRQAWFGEFAAHIIAVRYDSVTEKPTEVMDRLYDLLCVQRFRHDFENLDYDEPEFDAELGLPGFHRVACRVERPHRTTILPPDLFRQYHHSFWDDEAQNPRGVTVLC